MNGLTGRKRLLASLFIVCCAGISVLLAACTTSQQVVVTTDSNTPITFHMHAELTHSPTGAVTLSWNPSNDVLTVNVSLTGLAPNSTHPEHIHAGTCASNPMGPIVYSLAPLVANAHGVATSTTTIAGVMKGIPASGWYVNVHNGPQLATVLQGRAIACATVYNTHPVTDSGQTVHVQLGNTMDLDESAHGEAQLSLQNDTLVVNLTMSGLAPNTAHMAHIHAGSCESQGAVVYPLQLVVADGKGNATVTTTINDMKTFPTTPLYINIHEAGTMSGMSTQTGFNPIACGNITYH